MCMTFGFVNATLIKLETMCRTAMKSSFIHIFFNPVAKQRTLLASKSDTALNIFIHKLLHAINKLLMCFE